jgi:Protein of unknown function (DUF2637)
MRKGWARIWPSLLAAVTLPAVGGPAAVASYRHARDVIAEHGDPVMAAWLALTTDGMLLAALVVIWVRRHRREPVGVGPWAAFWAGMAATIAANLAAAQSTPVGIVVALWPPVCLAITLELIALIASPTKRHPITDTLTVERPTRVPDHAQPVPDDHAQTVPGHNSAVTGLDDRAPETAETGEADEPGHDIGTDAGTRWARRPPPTPSADTVQCPRAPHRLRTGTCPRRCPLRPLPTRKTSQTRAGRYPRRRAGTGRTRNPATRLARTGTTTRSGPGECLNGDILAWLREQTGTTRKVPGRRKVIDKWALGSPRADRLRRIVHAETARNAATASAG